MASVVRGIKVEREKSGDRLKWTFKVRGATWEYVHSPDRRLYRLGRRVEPADQVLCVDDAVLYALGFETGGLWDFNSGHPEGA
jgi:hypothetical protein